uniref:Uncharacterized protein n=1 Tax=viral metagenome TaxID=1070528 RepID=A0A6C0I0U4_9ZZZZ
MPSDPKQGQLASLIISIIILIIVIILIVIVCCNYNCNQMNQPPAVHDPLLVAYRYINGFRDGPHGAQRNNKFANTPNQPGNYMGKCTGLTCTVGSVPGVCIDGRCVV